MNIWKHLDLCERHLEQLEVLETSGIIWRHVEASGRHLETPSGHNWRQLAASGGIWECGNVGRYLEGETGLWWRGSDQL